MISLKMVLMPQLCAFSCFGIAEVSRGFYPIERDLTEELYVRSVHDSSILTS